MLRVAISARGPTPDNRNERGELRPRSTNRNVDFRAIQVGATPNNRRNLDGARRSERDPTQVFGANPTTPYFSSSSSLLASWEAATFTTFRKYDLATSPVGRARMNSISPFNRLSCGKFRDNAVRPQLHADAGFAEGGKALIIDDAAGEAGQDRR